MNREGALKAVLAVVGLTLDCSLPADDVSVAERVAMEPNQPEYEKMILGVYATLGVFLLLASRNLRNRSLIAFTAWSSLVHAAIMAVQAFRNVRERGHFWATYLRGS